MIPAGPGLITLRVPLPVSPKIATTLYYSNFNSASAQLRLAVNPGPAVSGQNSQSSLPRVWIDDYEGRYRAQLSYSHP